MVLWHLRYTTALLTAAALVVPTVGMARPVHHSAKNTHEAELEARLQKLEDEVSELRGALKAAKAQQASTTPVPAQAPVSTEQFAAVQQDAAAARAEAITATRTAEAASVRSVETQKKVDTLADATPKQGFRSGNSNVVLSGYIKLVASSARYNGGDVPTNTLGRDLYLPQSVPVFNPASPSSPTTVTDFSAKQTRFWVDANTKLGRHALKAYIEFDFQAAPGTPMALGQGTQRTTNAYDLAMRRAFIQFDRWTFGQDFTNFENVATLPESTDYVGGIDGLIFARQPMVRYALPVAKNTKLYLAVENPETASATVGAAGLIENGEDHAPDATARLEYVSSFGLLDLATVWRELRVDNAKTGAAHIVDSRLGWGVSAQGKIFLSANHLSDIRFQATYGEGIGRYLGLNFSPDAVLQANGNLGAVRNIGLFGAGHIAIDKQWRVNLIGSWQKVNYAGYLDHSALGVGTYNREAWSAAGNVFFSPVSNVDLGIEYRHGNREIVDGLNGHVDKFDFAAKYSF